jgi:hypothetical protein
MLSGSASKACPWFSFTISTVFCVDFYLPARKRFVVQHLGNPAQDSLPLVFAPAALRSPVARFSVVARQGVARFLCPQDRFVWTPVDFRFWR